MTDNVPCAVCGDRVYLDSEHARLNVEFRASPRRDDEYVAHVDCVAGFNEPEP
jgi:hypothetical protein